MITSSRNVLTALAMVLAFGAVSCAPQMSRPVTEREKTAAWGGLAGGAGGAIIGSMAGSAVAGGLFGIPIGAVAGWYLGDQYDLVQNRERARTEERESELERLRRENERLRRDNDDIRRPSAQAPAGAPAQARVEQRSVQEEQLAQSQQRQQDQQMQREQQAQPTQRATVSQVTRKRSSEEIREAQRALNKMGFDAGNVDGIWGPVTASAIRNFQQSQGIEATGQLNDRTMEQLGVNGNQQPRQGQQMQQSQDKQQGQPMQYDQNKMQQEQPGSGNKP